MCSHAKVNFTFSSLYCTTFRGFHPGISESLPETPCRIVLPLRRLRRGRTADRTRLTLFCSHISERCVGKDNVRRHACACCKAGSHITERIEQLFVHIFRKSRILFGCCRLFLLGHLTRNSPRPRMSALPVRASTSTFMRSGSAMRYPRSSSMSISRRTYTAVLSGIIL